MAVALNLMIQEFANEKKQGGQTERGDPTGIPPPLNKLFTSNLDILARQPEITCYDDDNHHYDDSRHDGFHYASDG